MARPIIMKAYTGYIDESDGFEPKSVQEMKGPWQDLKLKTNSGGTADHLRFAHLRGTRHGTMA